MKNLSRSMTTVLALALLGALSASATAQSGGGGNRGGGNSGGGGGGASTQRHGGSFNLTFDRVGTSAGSRATCLGGYNYTTYVTTLSLDYKLNNCSLPDGTVVYATVYSTDYYTGLPWAPMSAGGITVLGGKATFHNPNVLTTGVFGLPVPTQIVLTLAGGTVLFNGHP